MATPKPDVVVSYSVAQVEEKCRGTQRTAVLHKWHFDVDISIKAASTSEISTSGLHVRHLEFWNNQTGKVTVGLASHWLCVTDISGLSTYGLNGL